MALGGLPIGWPLAELARGDQFGPLRRTNYILDDLFVVQPVFDLVFVNNDADMIPLPCRVHYTPWGGMQTVIRTGTRKWVLAVWVSLIV